jgi:NAD(P)-dependent dehydrogenase (short-subunit alcohol dehydrogenase family)
MSEPFSAERPPGTASNRMKGRICLVTGGGTGIGRATAIKMAKEGAMAVVIAGRREVEIESAAAECRTLGAQALAMRSDVTQEGDVECLIRTTVERYGRLDVALNNAGFQERRAPIEQQGSREYDDVFDANVRSVFLCLRHQLPVMFTQREGRIVVNAR